MVSWVDFNNSLRKLRQNVRPLGLHEFVFNVILQSSIELGYKAIIILIGLYYKVLELDVIGGRSPCLSELGNLVLRVAFLVLVTVELTHAWLEILVGLE